MAISIFLKLSFRASKTVPEVTAEDALQTFSVHLKRLRLVVWQRTVPHLGNKVRPVSGLRRRFKSIRGSFIPHLGETGHRQRSPLWRQQEMLALGHVFGVRHGSLPSLSEGIR